jgi:4-amino-4-deoxy-L-arabinose transferase-like glycosyltransferase
MTARSAPDTSKPPALFQSRTNAWIILATVFLAVHFAALFSPAQMDDVDSGHAEAAAHMAVTGNWITPYIDGVRYLEKPPMYYWLAAIDYRIFGFHVFSTHLPLTLSVLGLAVLAWFWGCRAYGERAGFYAALAMLTAIGVFLFTRLFIPDAILTFFLLLGLYMFFTGLEDKKPYRFYIAYAAIALALLSKGLIAIVFFWGALIPYLLITGEWRRWRQMRLVTGTLLFFAIAAPWHILCGLANPDQGHPLGNIPTWGNVHGFLYFYFINEHLLRFLGTRYPRDYGKEPSWVYWLGQLVWIFPWSLYLPIALRRAWRNRSLFLRDLRHDSTDTLTFLDRRVSALEASSIAARLRFRARTSLLLACYAGFILLFFGVSGTNDQYYTWPTYMATLLILCGSLAAAEESPDALNPRSATSRWLRGIHLAFTVVGVTIAGLLAWGLWSSRHLPYISDIGTLLAHRGVGDYAMAMSHLFDITNRAFAALRLPAGLACAAFLFGPLLAWILRRRGHHFESTISLGFTTALFLIAAHIAFARFSPLLSSRPFATTINRLTHGDNNSYTLLCYGDQSECSSVIFYTHHFTAPYVKLVHGRYWYFEPDPKNNGGSKDLFGSSMLWGSDYPDTPNVFLDDTNLAAMWGHGKRKFLFVPPEYYQHIQKLLGGHLYELQDLSDKTLYTDRPLTPQMQSELRSQ